MKVLSLTTKILLLIAALFLFSGSATASPSAAKKVLFFSKSSGFEHSAIKHAEGRLSAAEKVLKELGEKNNFEFTFTKDGSVFTPENIAKFDAFFFYTTGDLTEIGTDGNPPMSKEGKAAFLEAIKKGKGFIGTHSATDTFHSPGGKQHGPARYQNDGTNADPYIQMIGAEFIIHGSQQPGHMICVDKKFPGMSGVPADFGPVEEWYSLKDFAPDLHVLLVQDTTNMKKSGGDRCYDRPAYPATWAHHYGKGRVFYTNMGHREDVWTNPVFQQVLLGGINWAVGNTKANVPPNLNQVTPQAGVMPPQK
ncbi:MAG TPA: ThuA domain-containing protein [Verrucomicrobiae bacterium]|nr:ThuA domain-containing protein [Verrucomicrobiae bacterium]